MSRAKGKHTTSRSPVIDMESSGGKIPAPAMPGEGERMANVKGGQPHITQQEVVRKRPAIAEQQPEFRGIMSHGVPAEKHLPNDRAEHMRGPDNTEKPKPPQPKRNQDTVPPPVPVYIVPEKGGKYPLKTATPRHIMVPGFNLDPVAICGKDANRTRIRLMNADTTNNIRIAADPTSLVVDPGSGNSRTIGGALIPKGMTSYQDIETQDEIWAIAVTASTAVELQIIMETSQKGGGRL